MEAASAPLTANAAALASSRGLNRVRSDRRLIERFRAGDDTAFTTLFERHRPRVFAIGLGVLGSTDDAQDVVQDVFASAASTFMRSTPDEPRAWLGKVARNAAIDLARRRKPVEEEGEHAAPSESGPAERVMQRAELQELVHAMAALPEQQRSALVMRELLGSSYTEIGETLGIEEGSVRGLIARARVSLRAARESQELACAVVRERLAEELDGRNRPALVRRHLRTCGACREYRDGLRDDARTLRAIFAPAMGIGLGAVVLARQAPRTMVAGGILAKLAVGTHGAQVAALCVLGLATVGTVSQIDGAPSPVLPARHKDSSSAERVSPATTARTAASTASGSAPITTATNAPAVAGPRDGELISRERGAARRRAQPWRRNQGREQALGGDRRGNRNQGSAERRQDQGLGYGDQQFGGRDTGQSGKRQSFPERDGSSKQSGGGYQPRQQQPRQPKPTGYPTDSQSSPDPVSGQSSPYPSGSQYPKPASYPSGGQYPQPDVYPSGGSYPSGGAYAKPTTGTAPAPNQTPTGMSSPDGAPTGS